MRLIEVADIYLLRQGAGGDAFTKFVDDLIRAQALISSVPQNTIKTNVRTNIADGGVDTQVQLPIIPEPTGYLCRKTIWQYKATKFSSLTESVIRDEVIKSYAKECIENGYAYRLCICDSLPPDTLQQRKEILNAAILDVSSTAESGEIVTAEELATWANMFPSVIAKHFGKGFGDIAQIFTSWGRNITELTSEYFLNPNWQSIVDHICDHLEFSRIPHDVLVSISGQAGVGKTRLVYETIKTIAHSGDLVLYVSDEDAALRISTSLSNYDLKVILVADECSPANQEKLRQRLRGHKQRIRVIAIDAGPENVNQRQYLLDRLSVEQVLAILEANFPDVPPERQRAYSELAGGFVRMAADLCSNDALIVSQRASQSQI